MNQTIYLDDNHNEIRFSEIKKIESIWKVIALIAIVVYLIFSYPEIKQGIIDGWFGS